MKTHRFQLTTLISICVLMINSASSATTCGDVKHLYLDSHCCAEEVGANTDATVLPGCSNDKKSAVESRIDYTGQNAVRSEDHPITKSSLDAATYEYVPLNAYGFEGAAAQGDARFPAVTETHYYTSITRAVTKEAANFADLNRKMLKGSDEDINLMTGGHIQCRDRKTHKLTWAYDVTKLTGNPRSYVRDVTVTQGVLYANSVTHYQLNSGIVAFALNALTGELKWSSRVDRMHLTFDNIAYVPTPYIDQIDVPMSELDRIPEFRLKLGLAVSPPIKVGASGASIETVLLKMGFKNVNVIKNTPYTYVHPNYVPFGRELMTHQAKVLGMCDNPNVTLMRPPCRTLTESGHLTGGALTYDVFLEPVRGLHYTTDVDEGIAYDFLLASHNRKDMSIVAADLEQITYLSPYEMQNYKFDSQLHPWGEGDVGPFSMPLIEVLFNKDGIGNKKDGSTPVAKARSMNLQAAAHNAPQIIGDQMIIALASIAYHYSLTASQQSDGFWKRYSEDQTAILSLNRFTGSIMWMSKNSPDHLNVNQMIPESAACYKNTTTRQTKLWFRRSLADAGALSDMKPFLDERILAQKKLRIFMLWGVGYANHKSPLENNQQLNDFFATAVPAYGDRTRSIDDMLPDKLDFSKVNNSFTGPSGNKFPSWMEGAVFIDGPVQGTNIPGTPGMPPSNTVIAGQLIHAMHVGHPFYIDWDISHLKTSQLTGEPWPDHLRNGFFYYEKEVGQTITHIQEQYDLMYSGGSPYGAALNSADLKSRTMYYSTGHSYHIPTNDVIRMIEKDSHVTFDPDTYTGFNTIARQSLGVSHHPIGFNPAGVWTSWYLITSGFVGVQKLGWLGPYSFYNYVAGNLQVVYWNLINNDFLEEVQQIRTANTNAVTKLVSDVGLLAIAEAETKMTTRQASFDGQVVYLSDRGRENYGGALVALDMDTGKRKWGSRNFLNNVFKHGGPFTMGTGPNLGNNNGAMLISPHATATEHNMVVLSTSKLGALDRFLNRPVNAIETIDGFTYPADVIGRNGQRTKMPVRKVLGVGDQYGGTVFGGWAYEKETNTLSVAQNNYFKHLAVGGWGLVGSMNPLTGEYNPSWVVRAGHHKGLSLTSSDGLVSGVFLGKWVNRYLSVVDMTEPDVSKMLRAEIPLDLDNNKPAPAERGQSTPSFIGGFFGRIISTGNDLIFTADASRATAETLLKAFVNVSADVDATEDELREQAKSLVAYTKIRAYNVAKDGGSSIPVWESKWVQGDDYVMPPIVDGKIYHITTPYTIDAAKRTITASSNRLTIIDIASN